MSIVIVILNVYFASAYLILPDFRSAQNYPVFLQALFDLFLSGYCSIIDAVAQHVLTDFKRADLFHRHIVKCLTNYGFMTARELVTAITILAIACQRYIYVCKPHLPLDERFYKRLVKSNCIITALTLLFILAGGVVIAVRFASTGKSSSCVGLYGSNDRWPVIVHDTFSFYIPAPVCTFLYICVGIKLWKTSSRRKRNRQLTVLFMLSCFLWIVFWLPTKVFFTYTQRTMGVEYLASRSIAFFTLVKFSHVFAQLFSTTQPFVIICCYRPLSQPLLKLVLKLRKDIKKESADTKPNN